MTNKSRRFSGSAILPALLLMALRIGHSADPIAHQITLPAGMTWCDDGMINGLFSQINTFRTQNGVAPFTRSTLGMKDAEIRATQVALYMSTATPGPGFNPHQGWETTAASLGYPVIGENIAYITTDPSYIVYGVWQDSLHRAAMLTAEAKVAGVSCVYYNGIPYWTYEPGSCSGTSCGSTGTPSGLDSEEWAFLTLINNYRAQNGLGALQVSAALENAARWMSGDLAAKNYFAHTDSLGRSTGARLAAFGYSYSWGENLAAGSASAQNSFNQWVSSTGHRQNMLTAGFKVIGIARAYSSSSTYGWYWVTDFGGFVDQVISPPSGPPSPSITSFVATPPFIAAGQTAILSWSLSGATTATIDNGVGNVSAATSKSVTPAQTTTYTLTATNGNGSTTAQVTVTVTAPIDAEPPTAPILTSATATGSTTAALTWTAASDNVGVAGYIIVRNGIALTSVSPTARAFTDSGVWPSRIYDYSLRANDAAGNYSVVSNSIRVTMPAGPGSGSACPAPATGAFSGCYYDNIDLTGNPVATRTDSQINFDWGTASPMPSVPADRFSVRWQGNFTFSAGSYDFSALTDDGMRVYVDGYLILNPWRNQDPTQYKVPQVLSAGQHLITVEYYDNVGGATAHLTWSPTAPVTQRPAILSFAATPSAITAGGASMLTWSVNGAATVAINQGIGDVSGIASRSVSPTQTTTYTLTASNSAGTVTAGATVTVTAANDTQPPTIPVLSSAVVKSPTQVDLTWFASSDNVGVAGYQVIRNGSILKSVVGALLYADTTASPNSTYTYTIRAYDAAGNYSGASNGISVTTPAVQPSGTCPAPAYNAFTGCYYNNVTLNGNPALIRTDSQINFDWGTGSPASSITPNNFSARWQGYFNFADNNYTFYATTSDGMRMYIDGNLVLDKWKDQAAEMYTVRQPMTNGWHLITLEYYARTGSSTAHLTWRKVW